MLPTRTLHDTHVKVMSSSVENGQLVTVWSHLDVNVVNWLKPVNRGDSSAQGIRKTNYTHLSFSLLLSVTAQGVRLNCKWCNTQFQCQANYVNFHDEDSMCVYREREAKFKSRAYLLIKIASHSAYGTQ